MAVWAIKREKNNQFFRGYIGMVEVWLSFHWQTKLFHRKRDANTFIKSNSLENCKAVKLKIGCYE